MRLLRLATVFAACGCVIASADARANVPTPLPPCAGEAVSARTLSRDTTVRHGLAHAGLA